MRPIMSTSQSIDMKLPDAVHSALIDPRRALEVQGWLRGNPERQELARAWRGSGGETMMHWAFLSSWSMALELGNLGMDYAAQDQYGRTPMDWLSDRLWSSIVEPVGSVRLSPAGQERLRKHTEEQVRGLWALGIRPSARPRALHVGVCWMRAGAWSLLDLLRNEVVPQSQDPGIGLPRPYNGPCPGWMRWTPRQGHALHAWVLSPDMPGRRQFLTQWTSYGLEVDARDEDGRTALWYAVEAALTREEWRVSLIKVIKELVAADADPREEDIDGASPLSLVLREQDAWTRHADLLQALGVSDAQPELVVSPLNPPLVDRALSASDQELK